MTVSQRCRTSPAAPILIAVFFLAIPLGAYVAGYFWLGAQTDWYSTQTMTRETIERSYRNVPLMLIYQPAGRVESWLCGIEVEISLADE
jgi:hypothetical protein